MSFGAEDVNALIRALQRSVIPVLAIQWAVASLGQVERLKLEISRRGEEVVIQWQSGPQQMSWVRSQSAIGEIRSAGRLLMSPTEGAMSVQVRANGPQEFFRLAQSRPIDTPTYEARSDNPMPLPSEDWREQAVREMREEIGYIGCTSDPVSGRISLGSWETLSPPLDPLPDDPQTVVKDFLNRWRAFFGYGSEVLDTAELIENGVAPVYGCGRSCEWAPILVVGKGAGENGGESNQADRVSVGLVGEA